MMTPTIEPETAAITEPRIRIASSAITTRRLPYISPSRPEMGVATAATSSVMVTTQVVSSREAFSSWGSSACSGTTSVNMNEEHRPAKASTATIAHLGGVRRDVSWLCPRSHPPTQAIGDRVGRGVPDAVTSGFRFLERAEEGQTGCVRTIRDLDTVELILDAQGLLDSIRGPQRVVDAGTLRALQQSGNYVVGFFDGEGDEERMVGASIAFFGEPARRAMHSHITALLPEYRGRGWGASSRSTSGSGPSPATSVASRGSSIRSWHATPTSSSPCWAPARPATR